MGLSKEWQIAIFSVIVPLAVSFIIFSIKKIIGAKNDNEKKYSILKNEREEIEKKLYELRIKESRFEKDKNEKLDKLKETKNNK